MESAAKGSGYSKKAEFKRVRNQNCPFTLFCNLRITGGGVGSPGKILNLTIVTKIFCL